MIALVVTLSALTLLAVGWLLYPVVLALLVHRRNEGADTPTTPDPSVTVVLATRETPDAVKARVVSLFTTDWPRERLHVVIGVDPNSAAPVGAYRDALREQPAITVVRGDPPGGKAATLNAAMREVRTALVVFADSAQQFDPAAVGALVAALRAPDVGGVTGEIRTDAEHGVFALFWRYELLLRQLESRLGLVVNVTGAIHAIRRSCWRPLPIGLICDDLLIPLQTGRQGWRTEVAPGAQARDTRQMSREVQLRRKIRTLTGVLQICRWEPWVLLPWRHRLWVAFVCHKLIRIATPLLVVMLGAGVALTLPIAWLVGGGVAALLMVAMVMLLAKDRAKSIAAEVHWALRLLAAPLTAASRAVRGDWTHW